MVSQSRSRNLKIELLNERTFNLWALVNPKVGEENVQFKIFGTGFDIEENQELQYIDTLFEGGFVWHVFKDLSFKG